MKILFRYTKPYIIMLLVSVLLLFVQAYTNLALPDYMSDIVNIGIQQGGIKDAVPQEIRKSTMDKLLLFMNRDDAETLLESYLLMQPDPASKSGPVYILKDRTAGTGDKLNSMLGPVWLTVSILEKSGSGVPDHAFTAFDFSKLPKGTAPLTAVKDLPPQIRLQIADKIAGKYRAMGPKMVTQAAVRIVKEEYSAIGIDTGKLQIKSILNIGLKMLLYTLISAAAAVITGFLSARIAAGYARDIRAAVFKHVENFGAAEFDSFSTASLITRTTNDVIQLQTMAVMLVTMVFYAPIIGIGGIIRAISKSSSMWWIIALTVGILMTVILTVYKAAVPKFTLLQNLMDRLNLVSRESLSGMMVIRAFNRQTYEEQRFDQVNRDLTKTMLFVNRVMAFMMPFMMLIMNGLSLLIIWVGAKQVAASTMQVGDMMAFMQYAIQIVFAFLMLSMMFIMLPRAAVSARRIAGVLNVTPGISDPVIPRSFPEHLPCPVEFKNVSFKYPGAEEEAVSSISFTALPGQITALIGTTGSGKSTLVNLIPRFYEVTEGKILVGGMDIRDISQQELRNRIGYIPQKPVLFSGTVASNLRYGAENTDIKTLETASQTAQAGEFIKQLEGGMDAVISQGGKNISGGQKQRISIARAFVRDSPVYIFDDCFSALDFATDAKLRRALRSDLKTSTLIIVAQRVTTIRNAEQIIVLDNGKIVGKGTHKTLIKTCKIYRELAAAQLTEEEPA